MARQAVVEIQCERCKRKEYVPVAPEMKETKNEPTLTVRYKGGQLQFSDLCTPCEKTVFNHIDGIFKAPKGKSPERKAKKSQPVKANSPRAQDS